MNVSPASGIHGRRTEVFYFFLLAAFFTLLCDFDMESDDLDVVEADAFREVDEPRLRVFT